MAAPTLFESLQIKIDEDTKVRDQLRDITQALERQGRTTQAILSRSHATPCAQLKSVVEAAEKSIKLELQSVATLATIASKSPYYKYNQLWTRDIQNLIFNILFCAWLGGMGREGHESSPGELLTIEDIGIIMDVPVNLNESDLFHVTIEEYLHSLISLIEELARLAINSVTLGDYERPLQISQFVKELHSGFQLLNLKNDSLRRRCDSIKYNVKKIEDIVYDLSLRNLIPSTVPMET